VCDGRYNVFRKDAATGKYISIASVGSITKYSIMKVWRVDLAAPTPAGTSEPPQKGPNPAPLDNVFGGWKITGASDQGAWGMDDTEYREFAATAKAAVRPMRQSHAPQRRTAVPPLNAACGSPPSSEPAVPGCPLGQLKARPISVFRPVTRAIRSAFASSVSASRIAASSTWRPSASTRSACRVPTAAHRSLSLASSSPELHTQPYSASLSEP